MHPARHGPACAVARTGVPHARPTLRWCAGPAGISCVSILCMSMSSMSMSIPLRFVDCDVAADTRQSHGPLPATLHSVRQKTPPSAPIAPSGSSARRIIVHRRRAIHVVRPKALPRAATSSSCWESR